jgi:hypothetical protein
MEHVNVEQCIDTVMEVKDQREENMRGGVERDDVKIEAVRK